MTAETLYPTRIAHLVPEIFLQFLGRHPEAYQMVFREMMRSFDAACAQLRTMGLYPSVPTRLARLLLGWSESGDKAETGARCRLAFTYQEIGEFIGATREAVNRTLRVFKHRRLVVQQGRMLTIPNREALERLACV